MFILSLGAMLTFMFYDFQTTKFAVYTLLDSFFSIKIEFFSNDQIKVGHKMWVLIADCKYQNIQTLHK